MVLQNGTEASDERSAEPVVASPEGASERSALSPKRGKGKTKKTAGRKPRGSKKSSAVVLFQDVSA